MEGGRGARTWVAALILASFLLLPVAKAAPTPSARSPWSVYVYLNCTQPKAVVSSTLADVVFVNNTSLEGFDNYTLRSGGVYTYNDFAAVGLNLTNVSEIVVMAHPPSSCPHSVVQEDDLNVSLGGFYFMNATFGPVNTSGVTILPLPPSTPGPVLPLFVQLVGVGVVALAFWFYVIALRKTTEVVQ